MTMVTWAGMMLSRAGLVICQPTTTTTPAVPSTIVKLSHYFLYTADRFVDATNTFENVVIGTLRQRKIYFSFQLLCSVQLACVSF